MKLIGKLFLLFTISTFVELYLLMILTSFTNIWFTIAATMISGMLGAWLAKREGLRAMAQFRAALRLEQEPTQAVLDGAMLLVAATLLFTPGVLTDFLGLLLLIPQVRRPIGQYVKRRVMKAIDKQLENSPLRFITSLGAAETPTTSNPFGQRDPFSQREPFVNRERSAKGPVIDIEPER